MPQPDPKPKNGQEQPDPSRRKPVEVFIQTHKKSEDPGENKMVKSIPDKK